MYSSTCAPYVLPCARSARARLHKLKMPFLCGGGSSAGEVLTEEEKKAAATAKKTLKAQAEADEKARCTLPSHPSGLLDQPCAHGIVVRSTQSA